MRLTLGDKTYELELNFRRIQQAQRRLGLPIWPADGLEGCGPHDFVHRLFAAAAGITLDESYEAVGSDEDLAALGDAVSVLMEAYQPEKWKALLDLAEALMEAKRKSHNLPPASATSGTSVGPSPASTLDSPEKTSASAPSASGPISVEPGRRVKPRETTRLRA